MNDNEKDLKAKMILIALNNEGLNSTAEAWRLKPTEEDTRAFWDGVVRDGKIPAGELTEEDRIAFNEALERLGEAQTPAFETFDQLLAEQLDLEDADQDYLD